MSESRSFTVGNCLVITAIDHQGFDVLQGSPAKLIGWRYTEEDATILALKTTNQELLGLLEHATGIVCNVDNGNLEQHQSPEWIEAARKFLDDAHAAGAYQPAAPADDPTAKAKLP